MTTPSLIARALWAPLILASAPFAGANDTAASLPDAIAPLHTIQSALPERAVSDLLREVGPATVNIKTPVGTGSGFITTEDGHIVTCAHVIEGANQGDITVSVFTTGDDGLVQTDYPKVRIIAYSGMHDLAVLKIESEKPTKFKWVPVGDSTRLRQAEKVFALGSPLGLARSASEGIISVRNRAGATGFHIQTTAQLSPGNSGGPLFNLRGEVVGVISLKMVSRGAEGLSFATPSDMLKTFLRNRDAFVFDPSNAANGFRYLAPPAGIAGTTGAVRLAPPLQMKLNAKCSLLRQTDIDGDKRADLVVANNADGRIELLYQRTPDELRQLVAKAAHSDRERPVLENAPFFRDSVTVGDDIHDLLPMDFDGDGLVDLVYTGRRTGLNVLFQNAPGKWEKTSRYDKYGVFAHDGTLAVADIDGDGKSDLVALVQGGRVMVFKGGSGKRDLGIPDAVGVANPGAQYLVVRDLNGDKRPDLLFVGTGPSGDRNLSLRAQLKDGSFGPEHAITLGLAQPAFTAFGETAGGFATIGEKTGEVRLVRLADREPAKDARAELQPQIIRPPVSGTASLLTTLADLTGSGAADVVIADSEGSSLYAYKRGADGRLGEDAAYPSLRSVSSLATIRLPGDKADRIVVASAAEKTVGLSEFKDGRLTFPAPLPLTTEPFVAATLRLGNDTTRSVVCATRDGQRFNLEVLSWDDAAKSWKSRIVKLGTLDRDPSGMLVRDINGDGLEDVLVFVPREPVRIITQSGGSLVEMAKDDPLRKSQLDGVTAEHLGFGDFDGDGRTDMLVARTGFVRAYAFSGDGKIRLIDQANARNATDGLSVPAIVDTDGDGAPNLVAYDAGSASLQVFARKGGVFVYRDSLFLGKNEPRFIHATGGKESSLLIAGARQVWNVPITGKQWIAETVTTARSGVRNARFGAFATAKLSADGRENLVAVDGANNGVEIFSSDGKGGLASSFSFRVFSDERLVNQGGASERSNPSEPVGGDFDADGREDLAVLCHDRLILYKQEK